MGLREDALAAAEAARVARQERARTLLAARLDPAPVDGLTVADVTGECVVFTDTGSGLCLAVADKADTTTVTRVTGAPGAWTAAPRRDVDTLATLGLILDDLEQGA